MLWRKKQKEEARAAALLAAAALLGSPFPAIYAEDVSGHESGGVVVIEGDEIISGDTVEVDDNDRIYGWYYEDGTAASGGSVTISGSTLELDVYGANTNVFVTRGIFGGYTNDGDADNNEVAIADGSNVTLKNIRTSSFSFEGENMIMGIFGGVTENGSASENNVTISDSKVNTNSETAIKTYISGGYTLEGEAKSNRVAINNSTLELEAYGVTAYSFNNTFEPMGGIVGGYTNDGDADNNEVTISNGSEVTLTGILGRNSNYTYGRVGIYGGITQNGSASGNSVTISDSNVSRETQEDVILRFDIFGGFTNAGDANANRVAIENSNVEIDSYGLTSGYRSGISGGYTGDGDANKNEVFISDSVVAITGDINTAIHGGRGDSASGNSVTIDNSTVTVETDIYGGRSSSGTANNNIVKITNDSIVKTIYEYSNGSTRAGAVYGGQSISGEASNNEVWIENSDVIGSVYGGYAVYGDAVYGGTYYVPIANNNVVTIIDSDVSGSVRGAYGRYGATGNRVTISGSEIGGSVYGASTSSNATITDNVVEITNSTVDGSVYGGSISSTSGDDTTVENTDVYITDSTINGDVYLSRGPQVPVGYGSYNNLILAGANTFGGRLYGALGDENNLHLYSMETVASGVTGFDTIYFYENNSALIATSIATFIDSIDMSNIATYSNNLAAGDHAAETWLDYARITVSNNIYNSVYNSAGRSGIKYNKIDGVGYIYGDREDGGLFVNKTSDVLNISDSYSYQIDSTNYSVVDISVGGMVQKTVITGVYVDSEGESHTNTDGVSALTFDDSDFSTNATVITGSYAADGQTASGGSLTVSDIGSYAYNFYGYNIYGGYSEGGDVTGNELLISGGTYANGIYGGYTTGGDTAFVTGNEIVISGGTFTNVIYGGFRNTDIIGAPGFVTGNTITIRGDADSIDLSEASLYGSNVGVVDVGNDLVIDTMSVTAKSVSLFDRISFRLNGSSLIATEDASGINYIDMTAIQYDSAEMEEYGVGDNITYGNIKVSSNIYNEVGYDNVLYDEDGIYLFGDRTAGGLHVNKIIEAKLDAQENIENETWTLNVTGDVEKVIVTGVFVHDGDENINSDGISSLTVDDTFDTNATIVSGSYATGDGTASGGELILSGNGTGVYTGGLYGGYSEEGTVSDNTITIKGTITDRDIYAGYSESREGSVTNNTILLTEGGSVSGSSLYGSNVAGGEGNTLYVDGWAGGDAAGVYNFNEIWFQNMEWETDATVLTITDNTVEGALSDTSIYLESITLDNVADLSVGDTMTFLSGEGGETLGIQEDNVYVTDDFTAGVAVAGTGDVIVDENTVAYTITGLYLNEQTDLITEAGAGGAIFVSNAADLISDALDALGRDELFGTKVFGVIQGVKNKYDISERLEITGWNVIAGVGNEKAKDNGVFSWAAFYEGGTGNFHTWNRFENELFHARGDITYHGGGLAAKYEADNGFYTEASVRAGHMDTDMKNALMDASGTTYGYDTSSSYWGAHIGIGKILPLSEKRDLDIYGKFYHTEIDGDRFAVAGDWFDLHDITSNRLRVGARVIADIREDTKGYYGLAWEHEFSGDAGISAYNLSSKSSFGGSTGVAEAGITWRPNNDRRWLVDLNARGYIGEREGGSLSMMVSYAF